MTARDEVARARDAFLAALPDARRAAAAGESAAVASALDALLASAVAEWPALNLDVTRFAASLAARLPEEGSIAGALASLRGADLYVAFACASGDARAIVLFERRYFAEIAVAVKRAPRARLLPDDVAQIVRERLFVARPGETPKILDYRGHGSIRGWLRVTAARIVLNLATRGPRETPEPDDLFGRIVSGADPAEIAHLKQAYRTEFRAALEAAVAALDPKDRLVLGQSFRDGLSIDAIAAIHGVHRATAARWITRAERALVVETRRALQNRLRATELEIDSIVRLISSRFGVTFGGLLGDPDPARRP